MWWVVAAGIWLVTGMFAVHDAVGGGTRGTLYGLLYTAASVLWIVWVTFEGFSPTCLTRQTWRVLAVVYWVWSTALVLAAVASFARLGLTNWLLIWTGAAVVTLGAVASWLAERVETGPR